VPDRPIHPTSCEPASPPVEPAQACTLAADELSDRMAWIRREILPHAVETVAIEQGLAFELRAAPGLADELDRLIALERECCSGIDFERTASSTPGRLRLEVRGVDPEAAVFRSLRRQAPRNRAVARLARAAAAGTLASLVVCCALPLGAALLLGTAALPGLASLDAPGPILAVAVLGGGAAWHWLGRRRSGGAAVSGGGCGPSC
jgi:hypothetical protein